MTPERLHEILDGFGALRLAIVGDFFLDKYLDIDPGLNEPSLETGLTAYQVTRVRCSPGAAGTVANNLCALGVGAIHAVGYVGDDGQGYELRRELAARRVNLEHLLTRSAFWPERMVSKRWTRFSPSNEFSGRLTPWKIRGTESVSSQERGGTVSSDSQTEETTPLSSW